MISTRASTKICCSPKQAAQLSRAVTATLYHPHANGLVYTATLRLATISPHSRQQAQSYSRGFSTTSVSQLRDFFPAKETAYIRKTPPAWPHHGYTEEEMLSVVPEHRR